MRDFTGLNKTELTAELVNLGNSIIIYKKIKREAEDDLKDLKTHEKIAYEKSQSSYGLERIEKEKERIQATIDYLNEKIEVANKEIAEIEKLFGKFED